MIYLYLMPTIRGHVKQPSQFRKGSGYRYGTVPGGRWAIDTEGGHVVVSVSLIRIGYENGRRSRGSFRIPPAIVAICL